MPELTTPARYANEIANATFVLADPPKSPAVGRFSSSPEPHPIDLATIARPILHCAGLP